MRPAPPPAGAITTTCHRDGTCTYYDHRRGMWIERATSVPEHVLAVLPCGEAARVRRCVWMGLPNAEVDRAGEQTQGKQK
jgi:hypothetical protein